MLVFPIIIILLNDFLQTCNHTYHQVKYKSYLDDCHCKTTLSSSTIILNLQQNEYDAYSQLNDMIPLSYITSSLEGLDMFLYEFTNPFDYILSYVWNQKIESIILKPIGDNNNNIVVDVSFQNHQNPNIFSYIKSTNANSIPFLYYSKSLSETTHCEFKFVMSMAMASFEELMSSLKLSQLSINQDKQYMGVWLYNDSNYIFGGLFPGKCTIVEYSTYAYNYLAQSKKLFFNTTKFQLESSNSVDKQEYCFYLNNSPYFNEDFHYAYSKTKEYMLYNHSYQVLRNGSSFTNYTTQMVTEYFQARTFEDIFDPTIIDMNAFVNSIVAKKNTIVKNIENNVFQYKNPKFCTPSYCLLPSCGGSYMFKQLIICVSAATSIHTIINALMHILYKKIENKNNKSAEKSMMQINV